jgi:DNA polymerase-3 subunit alpha
MGVEVLPPDINESGVDFTPLYQGKGGEKKGVIRFGLAAVKGVGEKAVEQIIASRQKTGRFKSLFHFCENVDMRAANKQVMEALIKAGAFDRLGGTRPQMIEGLERAMEMGTSLAADRQSGQMNFFGGAEAEKDYSKDYEKLPQVAPWPEQMMLQYEKQVLGFYVTSNPLSRHAEMMDAYSTHNSSRIESCRQDEEVIIGGMVTRPRYHLIKNGRNAGAKMGVYVLEDPQGTAEVVLFPKTLQQYGDMIVEDSVVFVRGKVDCKREKPNVYADELISIEDVTEKLAAKVRIRLDAKEVNKERIAEIKSICQHHKGRSPLFVSVKTEVGRVHVTADKTFCVNPSIEFCKKMKRVVGAENFTLAR